MEQLRNALKWLGHSSDEHVLRKFQLYMEGILKWNKMVNMTTILDRSDFLNKHFIDSLLCTSCSEFQQAERIVDVGTGAGFPGVPLALVAPDKNFVLIDSLGKRVKIIRELCDELGIYNVKVIHGRAEDLGQNKEYRQKYDLCVSRAVANLAILSEYCLPFIRPGGYFLAYKGPGVEAELVEGKKAIHILGGSIDRVEEEQLPGLDLKHKIIYIKKERLTPSKYPRKAGTPSKVPLK